METRPDLNIITLISANIEWQVIRTIFARVEPQPSPLGEWFIVDLLIQGQARPVLFFHGGWGKISAAASTEYVISRWSPRLLVNLGTCGGLAGEIERGAIILVERTVVYDIIEQMGDYTEHIAHYSTTLDLSWLESDYPHPVRRTVLVSADRDLLPAELPRLKAEFGAVAGDWESGAIAWVAARHHIPCLILRGVTDLVGHSGGEAYQGNYHVFVEGAQKIMRRLVEVLPAWLAKIQL
jgi:adenosylhomocysteine nucleosidase